MTDETIGTIRQALESAGMQPDHQLYYTLDSAGAAVPEPDVARWAIWMRDNHEACVVAVDEVGDSRVSTVFLGIDHAWHGGPPLLWETCLFGPDDSDVEDRYASREAAEQGHRRIVAALQRQERRE